MVFATRTSYQSGSETLRTGTAGDDGGLDRSGAVDEEDLADAGRGRRGQRAATGAPAPFHAPKARATAAFAAASSRSPATTRSAWSGRKRRACSARRSCGRRLPDGLAARRHDVVGVAAVDGLREGLRRRGNRESPRRPPAPAGRSPSRGRPRPAGRRGRARPRRGGRGDAGRAGREGARAQGEGVGAGRDAEVATDGLQLLGDLAGASSSPSLP